MKFYQTVWFKCITCLLLIAVISGALLATLNDVLAVSPETRTMRAITKIYSEEKDYATILDVDSDKDEINEPIIYDGVGQINKIYKVSDDLLFQTTGYQGYKNGTVTLWIKTVKTNETYSIDKILLQSFEKQTLMNNLSDKFYEKFTLTDITEMYASGNLFFADSKADKNLPENNVVTNATGSSTAACNAVNSVIRYLGGER